MAKYILDNCAEAETTQRFASLDTLCKSGPPCHSANPRQCRKKAAMQPNFLHTVAGKTARVGVRDFCVRVTCVHTLLRAACSQ
jgi:hypothetical protein